MCYTEFDAHHELCWQMAETLPSHELVLTFFRHSGQQPMHTRMHGILYIMWYLVAAGLVMSACSPCMRVLCSACRLEDFCDPATIHAAISTMFSNAGVPSNPNSVRRAAAAIDPHKCETDRWLVSATHDHVTPCQCRLVTERR